MVFKRRRGILSDWILALRTSRKARRLRRHSPMLPGAQNPTYTGLTPYHTTTNDGNSALKKACSAEQPDSPLDDDIAGFLQRSTETAPNADGYFQTFEEDYPVYNESLQIGFGTDNTSDSDSLCSSESSLDAQITPCAGEHGCSSQQRELAIQNIVESSQFDEGDYDSVEPDLDFLRSMRRTWENHHMLTAMIAVVGSLRYSVQDYEYCRDIVKGMVPGAGLELPTYSKVHKQFKKVTQHCLPASGLVELQVKATESRRGTNGTIPHSGDRCPPQTEQVRIFLPSAWAKLDVATSVVYDEMYSEENSDMNKRNRLERSRAVQEREIFTSSCDYVMIPFRGENVACGPGTLIQITLKGSNLNFDTPYNFSISGDSCSFSCIAAATWCVGAKKRPNPSYKRAKASSSLSSYQRAIMHVLSTAESYEEAASPNDLLYQLVPGDICTLLSSESASDSNLFNGILVHRFWRFEDGTPSSFIIWVRACESTHNEPPSLDVAESSVVNDITVSRHYENPAERNRDRYRSQGILLNGTRYVVYRILLYCDDFQKSSGPYSKGSAGGCYFLPMSLPPEARRSTSAVRIISLTPPGVSTNEVLRYINDDLVSATVNGIDGTDPKGEKVKIFIDVMGFIGDYPAAAGAVDVIGHVGRAPCNLCSFRRPHANEADGSRYGYTTSVHAWNSTFLRHSERHLSLRRSAVSDRDANFLGMISSDRTSARSCPLIHFSEQLEAARSDIPLTSTGSPVLSGLFDPYRMNIIAPDHLLTGMSKDILNTVFQSLPYDDIQMKANIHMCAALRDNGLLKQAEIFNTKSKTLHGMSLSEIYCVMLVAEPIMNMITASFSSSHVSRQAYNILAKLQALIALTYWWPQRNVDGYDAVCYVDTCGGRYHSDLKLQAKAYVQQVHRFCESFPSKSVHLDKPNLHRLIELYEHSIPMFGHAREFMELVFESAHQPLKRCIENSNNHNSHIFAAEHCVGNDWQGRLASLSRNLQSSSNTTRLAARRGLRRLMLGENADVLDDSQYREFVKETDEIIERLFTRAVRRRFQKDKRISNFAVSKQSSWKARGRITTLDLSRFLGLSRKTTKKIVHTAIQWIDAMYPPVNNTSQESAAHGIALFGSARRVKLTAHASQIGKPNGTDTITTNSVVRGLFHEEQLSNKILQTSHESSSLPAFLAIVAILHRKGDMVWAICLKCTTTSSRELEVKSALDINSFQVLLLTPDIRRVAVYHKCDDLSTENSCTFRVDGKTISHSQALLSGARMVFQTRREGYPPRQA